MGPLSAPSARRRAARVLLPVVLAALVPVSGAAVAEGFRFTPPQRTVLKNGLTVLLIERRGVPLVQIRLLVRAGAAADAAGKEGTAALTARLLKRGTRDRTARQIAEESEFVGGVIGAWATHDSTSIAAEFATRDIEVAFNLFADLVLNPAFREDEVAREKRLLLAEIQSVFDEPAAVASVALARSVFAGHPYGRPVEGTRRSAGALTRADLAAFHEARYSPHNAILVVSGDIQAAQTMPRVEKAFGAWKRRGPGATPIADPQPVRGRQVVLVDRPEATQSQIRIGRVGLRRADPEFVAAEVANGVLGGSFTSMLSEEIRVKRGLTYAIQSRLTGRRAAGLWSIATFSRNETVLETIRLTLDEVRRARAGEWPEGALEKTHAYLAGQYPLSIESPEDLAAEALSVEFHGLGPDAIPGYQAKVRGAGAAAVRKAAARVFPDQDLVIVVVGPAATLREPLFTLGPVTLRSAAEIVDPS
jgi:zinc protease